MQGFGAKAVGAPYAVVPPNTALTYDIELLRLSNIGPDALTRVPFPFPPALPCCCSACDNIGSSMVISRQQMTNVPMGFKEDANHNTARPLQGIRFCGGGGAAQQSSGCQDIEPAEYLFSKAAIRS